MLSSPLRAYLVVGGMEVTLGRILRGTLDPTVVWPQRDTNPFVLWNSAELYAPPNPTWPGRAQSQNRPRPYKSCDSVGRARVVMVGVVLRIPEGSSTRASATSGILASISLGVILSVGMAPLRICAQPSE